MSVPSVGLTSYKILQASEISHVLHLYLFCNHNEAIIKERPQYKPLRNICLLFSEIVIIKDPLDFPLLYAGNCTHLASCTCLFLIHFLRVCKERSRLPHNTNFYRPLFGVSKSFIHKKKENSIITYIKTELQHLEHVPKCSAFQS